jgi:formylmethanofuran dehydrogenase subunit C
MPLKLSYKLNTTVPVEVDGIVPHALADLSLAQIERLPVQHGNQRLPLAEAFGVTGSASDGRLEFSGPLAGVERIGAAMAGGRIDVAGDAGRHVGSRMSGGEIYVDGSVDDWLGAEMHGGSIEVRGNAGHLVGSAYRGSLRGMTGGTIVVSGNVGDECGHTLRRGLIAVGKNCGDFVGLNMIAGSVLVFGQCGARPGAGMRRGTIGLFGPQAPQLLPTFRPGYRGRPIVLALLLAQTRRLGLPIDGELADRDYWLYHGDLLTIGRGEIWVRAQ